MTNNKIVLGYIGNGKSTNRYHLPFVMQRPDKFIVKTIYNPHIHHDIWDKIEGVNYTENQDDIFLDDVIYIESWSPKYENCQTVKHWFNE